MDDGLAQRDESQDGQWSESQWSEVPVASSSNRMQWMVALGAAVGLGMLWMVIRSRRRKSRTEQARDLADRAASASIAQAQEWYEHRDEITENLVRVAEDLAHRAREQAEQARDVYDHRDELIRDLGSFARDAREELMRRSGRS